jgi:hypothetical protein
MEDLVRKTLPPGEIRLVASNIGLRSTAGRGTNGAASVFTTNTGPDTGFVQVNLVDPEKRSENSDQAMERVRKAVAGRFPAWESTSCLEV